jgi:D-glycero-alpha-D-manno-heptose-7-phosphate kinase
MTDNLRAFLEKRPIVTSAPCRIDLGGTLDLATFYNPLRHLAPCTFNAAVNLRTTVRLESYRSGRLKITSRGFPAAEFPSDAAPFDHPLGLMAAVAAFFNADGVHVRIDSASPPRSALGGSSVAAVALIAAFTVASGLRKFTGAVRRQIAMVAHSIESSVAGVPCGRQDQLAAAFGGVSAWYWQPKLTGFGHRRIIPLPRRRAGSFHKHFLLAYGGVPHESKDVNGTWVRQFLAGRRRQHWAEISGCAQKFVDALRDSHYKDAVAAMNRETDLRRELTPEVLDSLGETLVESARKSGCGARFTGAGGGGCIWALGAVDDIDRLRRLWNEMLNEREAARLLEVRVDFDGLQIHDPQ